MNNKTYCVLPYNHLSIDPAGNVRPCCNYNTHHTDYPNEWKTLNVQDDLTIEELLNGKAHAAVRADIEDGIKHKFCNRCWVVEDGGGESYRNNWNDTFLESNNTPKSRNLNVEYLEMTLGNKCNLQCRMCNPWSSHLWEEDIIKNPELNHWGANTDNINFEWYNTEAFDKLLEQIIPTVKHINMLGGEPLFNPKYYEVLQRIVDSGRAHEVSLQFNTNLLALKPSNLPLWKKFKWVAANISCDGVEEVNEFVRYPGKWNKFIKNLDHIIEWQTEMGGPEKLKLQIHSTMSSLTWLNLGELFKWCRLQPLDQSLPFLIQVNQPAYLDCINMPTEIKQLGYDLAIEGLGDIDDWQTINIRSLLDYVMNTPDDPVEWQKMIVATNNLDRVRNSNILDIIPQYEKYWNTKNSYNELS